VRLVLANLLCEEELGHRRPRTPSRETLRTVSGLATLLRVFAREGDRLWTPAPVEPEQVVPVPGLPVPILESGPVEPAEEVLAWCALRSRSRGALDLDKPLHELLWDLPTAAPEVVAAVHHRGFHLQVAEELGCALPGARMVESILELDRVLAAAPAAWVVKAPFSASGRSRYIERNGPLLSDLKARRTVERLFEQHGPLLFEPWMDRTADFGCAALLTAEELRVLGFHRQIVDRRGQFAGIELPATVPQRMVEVVDGVARALRRAGYVGPFGIDAWQYRAPDGRLAFHPLGEINARMTFGLVARALMERLGIEGPARLVLGTQVPSKRAIPLLIPGREGSGAAWIDY
jgi:hypothetical protein